MRRVQESEQTLFTYLFSKLILELSLELEILRITGLYILSYYDYVLVNFYLFLLDKKFV